MEAELDKRITTLFELLKSKKIKLTCAESCTGGLIAKTITDYAGSSSIFERGFVTYCNESKHEMLGVNADLFQTVGAVSAEVASEMASGALKNSHAGIAISCTGIAGPGGATEDKSVGLVYIGVAYNENVDSFEHQFGGDRESVREQTLKAAIDQVINSLEG